MKRERPGGVTTLGKRLKHFRPALVVIAVITIVVAIVVVRQIDERPRAEPGTVFLNPDAENLLPNAATVVFPWARLGVAAGEPRDELPPGLSESTGARAPEGGSFVHVQVTDRGTIAFAESSLPCRADVVMLLRADGTDYTLSGPDGLDTDRGPLPESRNDLWVAVEGHPEDLAVVVRIGDEEQVVDISDGSTDLGRAADLAALPSEEDHEAKDEVSFDCENFVRTDDRRYPFRNAEPSTCLMTDTLRTPYVGGLGWAEPGREFLVATLVLPVRREFSIPAGSPTKVLHATTVKTSATFGAQSGDVIPVDTWARGTTGTGRFEAQATQVIFDVAQGQSSGDLTIRAQYRARGNGAFAAKNSRADLEWTIPGRKLP